MSTSQLSMFESVPARQVRARPRTQSTSIEARKQIEPQPAATQRVRVLSFIRERGEFGATDEEMQLELGMNPSTQRPRRGELVKRGVVVDSERRRATLSGHSAIVWIAKEEAA